MEIKRTMHMHKIFLRNVFLWLVIFAYMSGLTNSSCAEKFKVFSGHSACLKKSPNAKEGTINKQEALDAHNKYRGMVGASNMLAMVWDDEVQMIAQKWAENCAVQHDTNAQRIIQGRFSLGQNIASSPGYPLSWNSVVELFYNETVDFKYQQTNDLKKVGHYTQLTWAESYVLGCGYAICNGKTHFYVCNYAPGGNLNGRLGFPYKRGAPNCLKTTAKLCDCSDTICEGGSKLNPVTCQCDCRKSYFNKTLTFLSGPKCRLNCTDLKEPTYCSGGAPYTKQNCGTLTNVPFECPKLCDSCPYADPTYGSGTGNMGGNGSGEGVSRVNFIIYIFVVMFIILYR